MRAPRGPEAASAARTPAERVLELRPPQTLAEVVGSVLEPAAGLRHDRRVPASTLDVRDGHLLLGGEAFAMRPGAARQLRSLAGVSVRSPSVALRRALALHGGRPVLVRLDGREVRAVLGASFAVLDDLDVFARVARAIEVRSGDAFERGVEVVNDETGRSALMLTPITFRLGCFNFSRSSRPTLRLVHAGAARHRVVRDLRKDIADALDAARGLLEGWRSSASFDEANAISDAAKSRSLPARITEERRAQRLVGDAPRRA